MSYTSLTRKLEIAEQEVGRQRVRIVELETANDLLRDRARSDRSYDELDGRYRDLQGQYRKLQDDHQRHLQLFERVERKYQDARRYCEQWREYYSSHRPAGSSLEPDVTNGLGRGRPRSTLSASPLDMVQEYNSTPRKPKTEVLEALNEDKVVHHPSSQTTESEYSNEHDAEILVKRESSPEIMSARPVKRRRGESPDATPRANKIKKETASSQTEPVPISSPSSGIPNLYDIPAHPEHHVSDLDTAQSMVTPRRRRRYDLHSASKQSLSEENDTKPLGVLTTASSLSDDDTGVVSGNTIMKTENDGVEKAQSPRRRSNRATPARRSALQPISTNITRAPRFAKVVSAKGDESRRHSSLSKGIAQVAEDEDVDAVRRQHTPMTSTRKIATGPAANRRHGRSKSGQHGRLEALLERSLSTVMPVPDDLTPNRANQYRRSKTWLEDASDKSTPSGFVGDPDREGDSLSEHVDSPRGAFPGLHASTSTTTPSMTRATPKSTSISKVRPRFSSGETKSKIRGEGGGVGRHRATLSIDNSPLRDRPLASLRLDDFKINPTHAGADFAFDDTIRGRDARRCLEGCTDPACCGETFVQMMRLDPSPVKLGEAELLEQYLGPDYELTLQKLSSHPSLSSSSANQGIKKEKDCQHGSGNDDNDVDDHEEYERQRQEVLTRARAWIFAKQFGKHRHVFPRRQTPPGFWRTDMPSTQESADDGARANRLEREQILARWIEAHRPGGRWCFRDE